MKMTVFRGVASCSLVEIDWHFRGAYSLRFQGSEYATHERSAGNIGIGWTSWNLSQTNGEGCDDQAGKWANGWKGQATVRQGERERYHGHGLPWDYMALHPRRLSSSYSLPQEPETLHLKTKLEFYHKYFRLFRLLLSIVYDKVKLQIIISAVCHTLLCISSSSSSSLTTVSPLPLVFFLLNQWWALSLRR
jgi:hypothetical protein